MGRFVPSTTPSEFLNQILLGTPWKRLGLPGPRCFQPLAFESNTRLFHQTLNLVVHTPKTEFGGWGGKSFVQGTKSPKS